MYQVTKQTAWRLRGAAAVVCVGLVGTQLGAAKRPAPPGPAAKPDSKASQFDPFAVKPTAAAPQSSSEDQAVKRSDARQAALKKIAASSKVMAIRSRIATIMSARNTRRSPNQPPAFTTRRPGRPAAPPANVPPGPPDHARPGPPRSR